MKNITPSVAILSIVFTSSFVPSALADDAVAAKVKAVEARIAQGDSDAVEAAKKAKIAVRETAIERLNLLKKQRMVADDLDGALACKGKMDALKGEIEGLKSGVEVAAEMGVNKNGAQAGKKVNFKNPAEVKKWLCEAEWTVTETVPADNINYRTFKNNNTMDCAGKDRAYAWSARYEIGADGDITIFGDAFRFTLKAVDQEMMVSSWKNGTKEGVWRRMPTPPNDAVNLRDPETVKKLIVGKWRASNGDFKVYSKDGSITCYRDEACTNLIWKEGANTWHVLESGEFRWVGEFGTLVSKDKMVGKTGGCAVDCVWERVQDSPALTKEEVEKKLIGTTWNWDASKPGFEGEGLVVFHENGKAKHLGHKHGFPGGEFTWNVVDPKNRIIEGVLSWNGFKYRINIDKEIMSSEKGEGDDFSQWKRRMTIVQDQPAKPVDNQPVTKPTDDGKDATPKGIFKLDK